MRARGKRTVCIVTGARSEYGLLRSVCRRVRAHPRLRLSVVACGMHLSPQFGLTYREIERDGFPLDAKVDMLFDGDTNGAMAKSIGVGLYGLAQAFERIRPDVVVVLGDRTEAFAAAVSAATLQIPVAHIHGGDSACGGMDEPMRHAITKFAHLHFAATELSASRIRRMGERPERIHVVGAPGLDEIRELKPHSRRGLERELGRALARPLILLAQHPVSTDAGRAGRQLAATLAALKPFKGTTVAVYPNADAGGRGMIPLLDAARGRADFLLVRSLTRRVYLSLLAHADVMVGNSSSAIIEAPLFHLPAVDVGTRQAGREASANVLHAGHSATAIRRAVTKALGDPRFRGRAARCRSPYGDGRAGARIANLLASSRLGGILQKRSTY